MGKQKEILAAALKLFVEFGFHGTPTSKIAKEAGVANGTLFHYYPTKDDLITSLYVSIKLKMAADIESKSEKTDDYKQQFKDQFVNAQHWAIGHPDEFQYVQQFYASPYAALIQSEILQMQLQKTCGDIQKAIDAGVIKPFPVDYIFSLFGSHLFGLNQYLKNSKLPVGQQKTLILETFELLWNMLT